MAEQLPEVEHTRESALIFFRQYIALHRETIKDKVVIDLSAGTGYICHLFEEAGAKVWAYDLFPEQNKFAKCSFQKIDLQQAFPIDANVADLVICSETIEHLPNQFFLFAEVKRILKPGGTFILTTPNTSSLRSRFSQFLMESEHYAEPAPNEINAFTPWGSSGYFGKLFLSGVLRLRTLAAINHLLLKKIHPTKSSSTSIVLLVLLYPVLHYFNRKALKKQLKGDPANTSTYRTIFNINMSRTVLLSKHLIMEFEKAK